MSFNFEEYTRKYDVHEETLALIKATPASKWNDVNTAVSRYSLDGGEALAGKADFEGSERELIVPSEDVNGKHFVLKIEYFVDRQLVLGIVNLKKDRFVVLSVSDVYFNWFLEVIHYRSL